MLRSAARTARAAAAPRGLRGMRQARGIKVNFITASGERKQFEGKVGQSLMEVGRDNGLDIEAACDGCAACSTCHCYVEEGWFEKLPQKSTDEEDMLDLALDLEDNSRLSCQVELTDELDGIVLRLPSNVSNQQG
eukprot:TRINITY_DN12744_c0_g1_i1.p1 TRINITY_DN12744_c0_g1~~TRINITY_DN12744_c0_g1_i1.p1  ORF type:complete len:135 (+),score=41.76 TRINITY_DN12744_c0_g1_i1:82-486(+)